MDGDRDKLSTPRSSLLATPTLVWLNWITVIGTWAGHNNLHLNRVKSVELIVSAPRRRRQFNPPPCIPEIKRVTTLTILDVTIKNQLSVSEHVRTVVNSCAQIMHAIRILRSRGMGDVQLQLVYRAVVVAKLTYASSSWWGFTTASDRQRLEGFLRRGCRQNLYSTDKPSITQIVEKLMKTFSIASNITHLIFSNSFYLHELNPVTACDPDPTTLNSLISTMIEILLTACFLIHTTTRNQLS